MYRSTGLTEDLLKKADCVVITTKHTAFDFADIEKKANLIVDLQNACPEASDKTYKL